MSEGPVTSRFRLLVTLLTAGFVTLGLAYWYAATRLPEILERDARAQLEQKADLARSAAAGRSFSDSLADELGRAAVDRVTLLDAHGRVVGDSYLPASRLDSIPSEADRPEVRAALRGQTGTTTGLSSALGFTLFYVAVPAPDGVIRIATPLSEVLEPAVHMRRALLAVAIAYLILLAFLVEPFRRFLAARPAAGRAHAHAADAAGEKGTQEEELIWVFDQMDDAVAVLDRGGIVVRANRALADMAAPQPAIGRPARSLFRDPAVLHALDRGVEGHQAETETESGGRTYLVSVTPHETRILLVVRDLTRLRRLEGVRRDFVANASHELKTPLTSILGFAETLQDEGLAADQRAEFVRKIRHNAIRMRRLVDDLLDLSRIESGSWRPRLEPVAIEAAARQAWEELGGTGERAVTLELDTAPAPGARADRSALDQIFRNLLDNARRYAPAGSAILVTSHPAEDRVRIAVSDRGPGIPMAQRERVFERFWRVDPGRSRAEGGTGLGLSIVRHLVAAHEGSVGIEGAPGQGATVWFTLPGAPRAA
jgi:two-component system phosphate regulon sensor histidine kinase PhoR